MSEYWKSTPRYWCKFCEVYVRDTGIERRNHEASGKHQGAIQRSLRQVHKNKQQEERDQQNAKKEVARLNGIVGQAKSSTTAKIAPPPRTNAPRVSAPALQVGDAASQRRATAEQWLAMGLTLPKDLQEELAGSAGHWRTVSERVVGLEPQGLEEESSPALPQVKGVHKRKIEGDEADLEAQAGEKKAWGSRFKKMPETSELADDGDLDALLNGLSKRAPGAPAGVGKIEQTDGKDTSVVISKADDHSDTSIKTEPVATSGPIEIKTEENETAITAPPVVTFKKRKVKR